MKLQIAPTPAAHLAASKPTDPQPERLFTLAQIQAARVSNPPKPTQAARCVSCGRLTPPDEIGAGVEGFASLCYCQRCEQERRQTELELVEVSK
jgi:hypothetical protein